MDDNVSIELTDLLLSLRAVGVRRIAFQYGATLNPWGCMHRFGLSEREFVMLMEWISGMECPRQEWPIRKCANMWTGRLDYYLRMPPAVSRNPFLVLCHPVKKDDGSWGWKQVGRAHSRRAAEAHAETKMLQRLRDGEPWLTHEFSKEVMRNAGKAAKVAQKICKDFAGAGPMTKGSAKAGSARAHAEALMPTMRAGPQYLEGVIQRYCNPHTELKAGDLKLAVILIHLLGFSEEYGCHPKWRSIARLGPVVPYTRIVPWPSREEVVYWLVLGQAGEEISPTPFPSKEEAVEWAGRNRCMSREQALVALRDSFEARKGYVAHCMKDLVDAAFPLDTVTRSGWAFHRVIPYTRQYIESMERPDDGPAL